MGGQTFTVVAKGRTAREAFESALVEARHEYGNRGYTGSIAEKMSYILIMPPAGTDPGTYANAMLDQDDPRISDKWGPAGCIQIDAGSWLFFGWASS
jgi:hypothetical protein